MKTWRITSLNTMKVVALPDLGVYLQPEQFFDVPEDRAVWSKDLQEALRTSMVRREVLQASHETPTPQIPITPPQRAPMKPTRLLPKPPEHPAPPKNEADSLLILEAQKTNQLLQEILTKLSNVPQGVPGVQVISAQSHLTTQQSYESPRSESVFIPSLPKEKVEVGGSLESDAKVSNSDKAKNARDKLRQMKGGPA